MYLSDDTYLIIVDDESKDAAGKKIKSLILAVLHTTRANKYWIVPT